MSISAPKDDLSFLERSEQFPAARSSLMAKVRGKNTTPEIAVRKAAHGLGYRFRLHQRTLPGSPDLVFPARRKVIFVHGCFWHRHDGCRKTTTPKTRADFWNSKFQTNVARDARDRVALESAGWEVMVVWECETKDRAKLETLIRRFLGPSGSGHMKWPSP
ncbi:very short patch repair endonuclease [Brevundimonas aurantiaca]|jgi:DNA mismatch endonuclease (patch repair protein)|uniref:very short patch repair endonuclease n=1 Tax=Brevundimonas aurantiaca TaxID=74316 RepID=UPI000C89D920|nr:DNA mismatch endonuclease Vsr [Brevundimonas aurantiaca]MAL55880.1 very short patch repair endonuclease [Brevundimonas sp.]MCC4295403.1 DNA mismatch endonuclease Vsr [Brevundimonas aurantiaca]HAF80061.1 very short patch repair endonuclease [Brevundimonas sp.]